MIFASALWIATHCQCLFHNYCCYTMKWSSPEPSDSYVSPVLISPLSITYFSSFRLFASLSSFRLFASHSSFILFASLSCLHYGIILVCIVLIVFDISTSWESRITLGQNHHTHSSVTICYESPLIIHQSSFIIHQSSFVMSHHSLFINHQLKSSL